MPTYTIETPLGKKLTIEAPDEAQAMAGAQQWHAENGGGTSAPPPAPEPITTNKVIRSAATGVPILGGLLNKANAATNAALAPIVEPFLAKGPETLDQPTFGERYAKSLELQNKQDERFSAEHPYVDTAAQLAGGVGATLPLAAGTLGPMAARAVGMGGNTLVGQTTRNAVSGGGIAAADALVRGNDPLAAGGLGTVIGAAAPVTGRIVGGLVEGGRNLIRGIVNPAEEAARKVAVTAQRAQDLAALTPTNPRNPLTPAQAMSAEAQGFPTTVLDTAGEPGRRLAQSAVNTSAEGGQILTNAMEQRTEAQSGRMRNWLQSQFHYPNIEAQDRAIANVQRTVNDRAYEGARTAADVAHPQGIWSPELERLTSSPDVIKAMKEAVESGKGRAVAERYGGFNPGVTFENGMLKFQRGATGVPSYPDLRFWDYTYRNLRDEAGAAFDKGLKDKGSVLSTQANQLRAELDQMVPEFGQARAGAAQFFGAHNALEAGRVFATPAAKFENDAARRTVAGMSAPERQLFQDGFVDSLVRQLHEFGNTRNAAGLILKSDADIERLQIALGPQRAREVEAMLRLEKIMHLGQSTVKGYSTTARQTRDLILAGGIGTALEGGNVYDPQTYLNAALTFGGLKARGYVNERVARQVAELLASNNHARVAQGMRIASQPRFLNSLRQADAAISKAASVQAEPHPTYQ